MNPSGFISQESKFANNCFPGSLNILCDLTLRCTISIPLENLSIKIGLMLPVNIHEGAYREFSSACFTLKSLDRLARPFLKEGALADKPIALRLLMIAAIFI